jgi:hypothetical protein
LKVERWTLNVPSRYTGQVVLLITLSAAQPQPNVRGLTIALVAGIPLCRAALKGGDFVAQGEM